MKIKAPVSTVTLSALFSALATLSVLLVGCSLMSYSNDSHYLGWMSQTEQQCASRYGPLPLHTAQRREEFLQLGYEAYYGRIDRATFVSRLGTRYPNHLLNIDCVATALPRLNLDDNAA